MKTSAEMLERSIKLEDEHNDRKVQKLNEESAKVATQEKDEAKRIEEALSATLKHEESAKPAPSSEGSLLTSEDLDEEDRHLRDIADINAGLKEATANMPVEGSEPLIKELDDEEKKRYEKAA